MAAQYRVDMDHTEHVAALALGMFDELARLGLHAGDPRERELLWAACMLHDIGMSIDYDDHHKHSRYLILNGALPGFTPVETAIIAQAARYHRKGMPVPGADGGAVRGGRRRAPGPLRDAAAPRRGSRALARSARARHQHRAVRRRGPAAADRRRRVGCAALGGRARARAVRPRVSTASCRWRPDCSAAAAGASAPFVVRRSRTARARRGRRWGFPIRDGASSLQARSTAFVARLPPRSEYSPPSST